MNQDGSVPRPVGLARHQELIDVATAAAAGDTRIVAAWLVGSLAADYADEFSDIDFHIAVADDAYSDFAGGGWVEFIASFTPIVSARPFGSAGGGYAITADWMHLDVAVHPASNLGLSDGAGFKPLCDRSGQLLPPAPVLGHIERGEPYYPAGVVQWFFYMLGNLGVVVGRNEPVLGMNGAVMLCYTCLVPLMHAEQGVVRTGGNKRMRPFLTDEQHAVLEGLPPIEATLSSVIDSYAATSEIFVERGQALADRTGGEWPQSFHDATRSHLERSIGRSIPGC